jgi:hypothetical protein
MAYAIILGSTDPHSNTVHVDTFFTSAFKDLTWMFATITKICTSKSSSPFYNENLLR